MYMFLKVLHGLAVDPDHTKNLLFVFMSVLGITFAACLLYFPVYSNHIKIRIDTSHNNKISTIVLFCVLVNKINKELPRFLFLLT